MTLHQHFPCDCGVSFANYDSYRMHVTEHQMRRQILLSDLSLSLNHSECSQDFEICVFCFMPFSEPDAFIRHARTSHQDAADLAKSIYMEAICQRLEAHPRSFQQRFQSQSFDVQEMQLSQPGDIRSGLPTKPLPELIKPWKQQCIQTAQLHTFFPATSSIPTSDTVASNANGQVTLPHSFPPALDLDLCTLEPQGGLPFPPSNICGSTPNPNFKTLQTNSVQLPILSHREANGFVYEEDDLNAYTMNRMSHLTSPIYHSSGHLASASPGLPPKQMDVSENRADGPPGTSQIFLSAVSSHDHNTQNLALLSVSDCTTDQSAVCPLSGGKGGIAKGCVRCKAQGRECTMRIDGTCKRCDDAGLRYICVNIPLSNYRIFQKWDINCYKLELRWPGIENQAFGNLTRLSLFHMPGGPCLNVYGRQFTPNNPEQTRLWGKTKIGWSSIETAPLYLEALVDGELATYIRNSQKSCVTAERDGLLSALYSTCAAEQTLVSKAFMLWTANRLLMKGWQCEAAPLVLDSSNPYNYSQPAPRVLQNQLDQHLEQFITAYEAKLVPEIDKRIKNWQTSQDAFLASIVLLKIVENDIWRLMYWVRHRTQVYKWRHPESPDVLIQRGVFFSRILLAHIVKENMPWPNGLDHHIEEMRHADTLRYDEVDDRSISGSLLKYAFGIGCDLSDATIFEIAK